MGKEGLSSAPFEIFINFPGDASRERLESPLRNSAGLTRWAVTGPKEAWWQRGLQAAGEAPRGTQSSVCGNQFPPNRGGHGLLYTPRSSVPRGHPASSATPFPGSGLTAAAARRCPAVPGGARRGCSVESGRPRSDSSSAPGRWLVLSLHCGLSIFKAMGTVTGRRSRCPWSCHSPCRGVRCGPGRAWVGWGALTATQGWLRLTQEDELMTL